LLELGHSHRRAVLLLYFWSAIVAFAGVGLSFQGGHMLVVWTLCALVAVAITVSVVPSLRARAKASVQNPIVK
jgi:UDP-GlcNAc:undecaprenyl-phosphate GlcNAc-1-phosphate transferase